MSDQPSTSPASPKIGIALAPAIIGEESAPLLLVDGFQNIVSDGEIVRFQLMQSVAVTDEEGKPFLQRRAVLNLAMGKNLFANLYHWLGTNVDELGLFTVRASTVAPSDFSSPSD